MKEIPLTPEAVPFVFDDRNTVAIRGAIGGSQQQEEVAAK